MSVLLKLFTPGGTRFYDLYAQVAATLVQMSQQFSEILACDNRISKNSILGRIEKNEQRNDDATHKLFVELGKNFITPFDREDIHFMASSLDDIADAIWATSKQFYHFDIDAPGKINKEVAGNIEKFCLILESAISGLRKRKALRDLINLLSEMRAIISENDKLISDEVSGMVNGDYNHVELIKFTDHYNMLQNLNNKCSNVINVLEGVIIKYS